MKLVKGWVPLQRKKDYFCSKTLIIGYKDQLNSRWYIMHFIHLNRFLSYSTCKAFCRGTSALKMKYILQKMLILKLIYLFSMSIDFFFFKEYTLHNIICKVWCPEWNWHAWDHLHGFCFSQLGNIWLCF